MTRQLSTPFLPAQVPDPAALLRSEIAQSWSRSLAVGLDPAGALDSLRPAEFDPGSRLLEAAAPVLAELEAQLSGTLYCTLLADRDCRIVYRWFDDPRVERIMNDLGARPGAMFLEDQVGTNALGTALETRRGVAVHSSEHFAEKLKPFSCYGQPIRHPLLHRVEGVLDFSALEDRANPLLAALIARTVTDIEQRLLDGTRVSERHLFAAFQSATSRQRRPIVALGDNVVLSNRAALDLLAPADYATLRGLLGDRTPATGSTRLRLTNGEAAVTAVAVEGCAGGALFEIDPHLAASATRGRPSLSCESRLDSRPR